MHCSQKAIGKFLAENNLPPIEEEKDEELAKFARGREGIIGIHFTLSAEDRDYTNDDGGELSDEAR